MALGIATILDSIKALSVSGVTIKEMSEVPEKLNTRDCPCLFPKPTGFITDLTVTPQAFGDPGTRMYNVEYNLHYLYAHAQVGTDRRLATVIDAALVKIFLIVDAIIAADNLTGTVEFQAQNFDSFGPIVDPSGQTFVGCELTFHVTQFVN